MSDYEARIKLTDTSVYPALVPAQGKVVPCIVQVFDEGQKLYHVAAADLIDLGCDVRLNATAFPFYSNEAVEV